MELIYYEDPAFNFGDDPNTLLWPRLLSARLQVSDAVLIGIGSILTNHQVGKFSGSDREIFVMGSGTSYGTPPAGMDTWHVLAVRGPLTASVIGRPEAAVTDGTILLLASVPNLPGLDPADTRDKVLFMPHYQSILGTVWRKLVADASRGLEVRGPAAPPVEPGTGVSQSPPAGAGRRRHGRAPGLAARQTQ